MSSASKTFEYTVRAKDGKIVKGKIEAPSESAVAQRLRGMGTAPLSINEVSTTGLNAEISIPGLSDRVGLKDLAIMARQMATMINAGLSLLRALQILAEQTESKPLAKVLFQVRNDVEQGVALSVAMRKHENVFPPLMVNMIKAGEVGGFLDQVLLSIAENYEGEVQLRAKVKSAMTYPVIVMFLAVGIVIFLVTFILPKFMDLFLELGMTEDEFPLMTRMLMNASHFLTSKWYIALVIIVLLTMAINRLKATTTGRRYYDMAMLKMPVFGNLTHMIAIARFARTLATLLSSGVPILQAMETVAGTVDNAIISDAVLASRASIREGDTIADPLAESKQFPPMVVQMISIGEETGQLDTMLLKVADFYEAEVDAALESLTAALEPVLIVFLGVVVGFIVVAMFLPLIGIISELSQ